MNPRAQLLLETINEEITVALEDTVIGQNMTTGLKHLAKRTVQSVLYRHNIHRSQINVQLQRNGLSVDVVLPPQGPIVRVVSLRFDSQSSY